MDKDEWDQSRDSGDDTVMQLPLSFVHPTSSLEMVPTILLASNVEVSFLGSVKIFKVFWVQVSDSKRGVQLSLSPSTEKQKHAEVLERCHFFIQC